MINNIVTNYIDKYGVKLKLVEVEDANFILELRNNISLNNHISPTSTKLIDQINWIEEYKNREKIGLEYYFITLVNGKKMGTTRLSDLDNKFFELGSWVFSQNSPAGVSIKADIITRELGFEILGFDYCKFSVRKANKSVLKYHLNYKPEVVKEDDLNIYFKLSKSNFNTHKTRFLNLL